ncbi:hypothetical protein [Phyllobacterium sophorae]|uniref:Uncharacterized protein n=1 Tax=Phyllobacterium sophorae TaxID=1520277 RepID=A0A2P7BFG2_9HYPH|nr:hypothetical protein [Phyllobacterium sophorae]PSH65165.1 hypothetical protein CU103_09080 [Phyllobacterium sophorae]
MKLTAQHAVEFTFPEEYTSHATYREAPYHLVEDFKVHVKETNTPETFPGLFWGRLNTSEPFEILHQFAVDRKRRPAGDYTPCPMCKHKEKFLEGMLVFVFARQCIAIIGHDCASAETRHVALSKKKMDDARRHQENFLMSKLHLVPVTLRLLEGLKPIATEIDGIYNMFKRGAPRIQKALRQAQKGGGRLVLTELVDNQAASYDDRAPRKVAREYHFGNLRGETLVRTNVRFLTDLNIVEQLLLPFADCENEEQALEMTVYIMERGEGLKAVECIGSAGKKLAKLRWEMARCCSFFADNNIEDIREWARHGLQPLAFDVTRQSRGDGIAVIFSRSSGNDEQREYARLFLPNRVAEWAEKNGDLPDLEMLVAAG